LDFRKWAERRRSPVFLGGGDSAWNAVGVDPRFRYDLREPGRLWIASSEVYPQIVPGAPATDRVVVVEDADHDGIADKTHVFAESLLTPTGIAPGDGGAWVANRTELRH